MSKLIRKSLVGLLIGILALGLAAPATFFSILWGGGFRPLPVPEGDRVVRMEIRQPSSGGQDVPVTLDDLEALRGAGAKRNGAGPASCHCSK